MGAAISINHNWCFVSSFLMDVRLPIILQSDASTLLVYVGKGCELGIVLPIVRI